MSAGFWEKIRVGLEKDTVAGAVTILKVEGSSPREAGARMVVRQSGDFHGTIGGGALEWEALREIRKLLDARAGTFASRSFSLGPQLGQCCGGRVVLGFEVFSADQAGEVSRLAGLEASRGSVTTKSTMVEGEAIRREVAQASSGGTRIEISGRELVEHFGILQTPLYLFGAGHVAKSLVLALAPLPFNVTWVDSRKDIFPPVMPQNVTPVSPDNPEDTAGNAEDGAFVLVMTHSHGLDLEIVAASLRNENLPFVGLIGSATKRARFEHQLEKIGLRTAAKNRLICPIGIDGISGKSPAEIAAATAAQLLIVRERTSGHRIG